MVSEARWGSLMLTFLNHSLSVFAKCPYSTNHGDEKDMPPALQKLKVYQRRRKEATIGGSDKSSNGNTGPWKQGKE
jgi:hypothetical protein